MEITTAGSYVAITKETKLELTANRNALHHLSLKEEIPQLSRKVRVSGNFYRNQVGTLKSLIWGASAPGSNPFTLLYTIFDGKGTTSPIPFIDKWYLLHITSLELCLKPEKWYPLRYALIDCASKINFYLFSEKKKVLLA